MTVNSLFISAGSGTWEPSIRQRMQVSAKWLYTPLATSSCLSSSRSCVLFGYAGYTLVTNPLPSDPAFLPMSSQSSDGVYKAHREVTE